MDDNHLLHLHTTLGPYCRQWMRMIQCRGTHKLTSGGYLSRVTPWILNRVAVSYAAGDGLVVRVVARVSTSGKYQQQWSSKKSVSVPLVAEAEYIESSCAYISQGGQTRVEHASSAKRNVAFALIDIPTVRVNRSHLHPANAKITADFWICPPNLRQRGEHGAAICMRGVRRLTEKS